MLLGHIELFVRDPLKSKEFYETILDFEVVTIQTNRFIWLKSGNVELLLRPGDITIHAEEYENTNVALVIYTDDLQGTAARMERKGMQFKGIDGEYTLTFTDPDGNWLQLVDSAYHKR